MKAVKRARERTVLVQDSLGEARAPMRAYIADAPGRAIRLAEQHEVRAEHRDFQRCVGEVFTESCYIPDVGVHSFLLSDSYNCCL
jgi:hypothetical protein